MARKKNVGSLWIDPVSKYLYGVITWNDPTTGKRKRKMRRAASNTKTEAYEHIDDMLAERKRDGEAAIDGARLTLKQLADHHKKKNLQPAEHNQDGIKKAGVLSDKDARRKVDFLVAYFGPQKLVRAISYGELAEFKAARMLTPVTVEIKRRDPATNRILRDTAGAPLWHTRETERAISSVHRELAALRRMLNVAKQHRWISHNPFADGPSLINPSEEKKRTTIATQKQELALLENCDDHPSRRHLRAYLTVAFDSGCRSIEIRRLRVGDVNFETNSFRVYSYKGKRRQDRDIEMTPRVRATIAACCIGKTPDQHVITWGKNNRPLAFAPKRAFATAKRLTAWWSDNEIDLSGFRGHDIRHTTTTRLIAGGMPIANAGKLLGHTQSVTTDRYNNPDVTVRKAAASILANYSEAEILPFPVKAKRKKRA